MNKKAVKSILVLLVLMVIALYFISGTYARYTSDFTAQSTFDVAKWSVKVGGTAATAEEQSKTFTPDFSYDENQYVANNKIAPGRSASANVAIDLEGTEVAVDVIVKVDTEALAGTIGNSKISVASTMDGQTIPAEGKTIELVGGSAFSSSNGQKTIKVTLTWDNDSDNNSVDDTKNGINLEDVEIPITVTLKQHIQEA